jgi:hypothetical protein
MIVTASLSLNGVCQQSSTSPSRSSPPVPPKRARQTPIVGSLGVACQDVNVAVYGNITFFERHDGVAYGVSTRQVNLEQDEDLRVYLWLSNKSTHPIEVLMCCGLPLLNVIQVVDSSGKRIVSGWERYNQKTKADPQVCTCSADEIVPPGSCSIIDSGVLNASHGNGYSMPPGTYTIMEDPQPPHPLPDTPVYPKLSPKEQRLVITITPDSDTATNK